MVIKDGWKREWIYKVVLDLPTVAVANEASHPHSLAHCDVLLLGH